MGDLVKWGLLIAGIVILVAMVLQLPIFAVDLGAFGDGIAAILDVCGDALVFARSVVNLFLTDWGATILTGLLVWIFLRWLLIKNIGTIIAVYNYLFR